MIFSSLTLLALAAAPEPMTLFSCQGSGFGTFPASAVGIDAAGQPLLAFAAPLALEARASRRIDGRVVESPLSGTIPATLATTVAEPFGSVVYRSDVTRYFQGTLSADTRIVVELSRPEGAYTTFSASLALWAEYADGERAALCRPLGSGCVSIYDVLSCVSGG